MDDVYHPEPKARNSLLNRRGSSFAVLGCIGVHYDEPESRLTGERSTGAWGSSREFRSANRSLMARYYALREGS